MKLQDKITESFTNYARVDVEIISKPSDPTKSKGKKDA